MSFLVENIDKNIKIKKIEELLKSLELQKNGIITEITSIQSMINNLQTEINKLQTEINIAQKEYQYTIITRLQSKKQIYNVQKSALQIDIDAKQRILNNIQISLDNLERCVF
jgi:chromosome segregation ATPase